MKNQLSNIALEGTCKDDVVDGLLLWTGESLQALLFGKDKLSGFVLGNKKPLECHTRGYEEVRLYIEENGFVSLVFKKIIPHGGMSRCI